MTDAVYAISPLGSLALLFGTTIVFTLIMLGWFYVVAFVILSGAIINAMRLGVDVPAGCGDSASEPVSRTDVTAT